MRVLLISPNREEINMRTLPLGLACVAAAVSRAGHEVQLLDLMEEEDPRGAVRQALTVFQPEAVGVSVRNIDDQKMESGRFLLDQTREMVSLCRELSQAPVILGGAGYSIFPRSALEYLGADMGLQGEGEGIFPRLLERLEKGGDLAGVPGLYLPGQGLQGPRNFELKLDSLPWSEIFPWFRGVRNLREYWMTVQTRRGCPLGCRLLLHPGDRGAEDSKALAGGRGRGSAPSRGGRGRAVLFYRGYRSPFSHLLSGQRIGRLVAPDRE